MLRLLFTFSLYLLATCVFAAPSVGCGAPSPIQSGLRTINVAGQAREFILSLPEAYDADAPYALVLAFHGRTSPAAEVQGYYGLESQAATLGPTVFVYPVALNQADGTFGWWNTGDAPDALRDFAFFDALVKQLSADSCIDTKRIFAVGHSLGGSFVNALGCHRARVLRAVASLGGGPGPGTCEGKIAAMVLHNPDDRLVSFDFGLEANF